MAAVDQKENPLESSVVNPDRTDEGEVSLPDKSEVLETIDLSNSNSPQQEELVFVNVDFEEIAQAVFGQLHFIDQVLAENLDSISEISDPLPHCMLEEASDEPKTPQETEELDQRIDLTTNSQDKEKQEKVNKTNKKESSKGKAKEDKSIEHILKALNSLETTEEKLAALCKKYSDLLGEHRALQNTAKQNEKKVVQLQKEKEQIQSDHSKAVLTRSRLENLCRELQRQNKIVKDESLTKIREEEERRKEVSAKFQTTLNEISTMMQDNNQKCSKLREENVELAQKLKSLIEQYEVREQQVEKVLTQKEHEAQLAETKIVKTNMLMVEEREKFLREKQKCLQDIAEYQRRCQDMATNEVQLRTQLSLYTDKYEEFQTTLSKSNEVFSHFKEEMDKMSKKIKKLEKETGTWKTRWESSNKALLEMAGDKQRRDLEFLNATKKIVQLEKLCRALQTERQVYLAQLKGVAQNAGDDVPTSKIEEIDAPKIVKIDAPKLEEIDAPKLEEIDAPKLEEIGAPKIEETDAPVEPQTVAVDTPASKPPNCEMITKTPLSQDLNNKELIENPCEPITEIITADKSQPPLADASQNSSQIVINDCVSQGKETLLDDDKNDQLIENIDTAIPTEENNEVVTSSEPVTNEAENDLLTKDTYETEKLSKDSLSPKTNKTKENNKGKRKGKSNVKSESTTRKNAHCK